MHRGGASQHRVSAAERRREQSQPRSIQREQETLEGAAAERARGSLGQGGSPGARRACLAEQDVLCVLHGCALATETLALERSTEGR